MKKIEIKRGDAGKDCMVFNNERVSCMIYISPEDEVIVETEEQLQNEDIEEIIEYIDSKYDEYAFDHRVIFDLHALYRLNFNKYQMSYNEESNKHSESDFVSVERKFEFINSIKN